jgi:hypothetical protein
LSDIERLATVSDIAGNQLDHLVLILAYQQIEGSPITLLDPLYQFLVNTFFAHAGILPCPRAVE